MHPTWIHFFLDIPAEKWLAGVEFWANATGLQARDDENEDGPFITLVPHEGDPRTHLRTVPGEQPGLHLRLGSNDRAAAVERAMALGAEDAWRYHEGAGLVSPGGLRFEYVQDERDHHPRMVRSEQTIADQVCIDVPGRYWDAEVAFWTAITGREPEPGISLDYVYLEGDDPEGPARVLLQRLHSDAGSVTAHLDFASLDRAGDVGRHQRLGAQKLTEHSWWTVMLAPSGHVYCLTDRDPRTGEQPIGQV